MNTKTLFFPFKSENPYINIVQSCIKDAGFEIYDIKNTTYRKKMDSQYKIVNLNWFDSISGCSFLKAAGLFIRQIIRIEYYRFCGIKIIYTCHNVQAHDTNFPRINRCLMKFLCKKSDCIVGLCSYTKNVINEYIDENTLRKKLRIINLPSYEGIYEKKININLRKDMDKFKILFLGMVRPYKNIELILDVAQYFKNEKIEFLIAGKPFSNEYKYKLEQYCSGVNNVRLELRFIDDKEIYAFYDWCDVSLLPLSTKSSLNSSSVILAFSMGKTVIVPKIGTVVDFPQNDIFVYEYKDEEQHREVLISKIQLAYECWKNNPDQILMMGLNVEKYLNTNYSKNKTMKKYKKLYEELIL